MFLEKSAFIVVLCLGLWLQHTEAAITAWSDGTTTDSADPFEFAVTKDETSDVSATIITVTATTGGDSVTYSIAEQPSANQFVISGSGGITLGQNQVLDRESGETLVIKVQGVDDAAATSTCTITLTVTDVNDNTPTFTAPSTSTKTITVEDGKAAESSLYTVTATDADATQNTVSYAIASGNTGTDFGIDASSGAISVLNKLEKSRTPSYALIVTATDSGTNPSARTGTATLSVVFASNGAVYASAGFAIMLGAISMSLFYKMWI